MTEPRELRNAHTGKRRYVRRVKLPFFDAAQGEYRYHFTGVAVEPSAAIDVATPEAVGCVEFQVGDQMEVAIPVPLLVNAYRSGNLFPLDTIVTYRQPYGFKRRPLEQPSTHPTYWPVVPGFDESIEIVVNFGYVEIPR